MGDSASTSGSVSTTAGTTVITHKRTIEKFDGKDYAIWAMHMRNILEECNLADYLKPQGDINNYDQAKDRKALAEICFTLANSQARHVITATTAKEAWDTLKRLHLHSSQANRLHLKTQLFSTKMKDKESIRDFANRVDELANQINSLSTEEVEKVRLEDKAIVITRGVPEKYSMVVIAMQESGKLADYEHVVTSLINEEARRDEGNSDSTATSEKAFFSSRGRGRGAYRSNQPRGRGSSSTTTRFEGTCDFCGTYGHKQADCFKRQNQGRGAHQSYRGGYQNRGGHQGRGNYRGGYGGQRGSYGYRGQANFSEQFEKSEEPTFGGAFVAETSTPSPTSDNWLVDSGASQHITHHKEWFQTYKQFKDPVTIELGDNGVIYAQGKGDITMDLGRCGTAIFQDVLYAPKIGKNLFSIGKTLSNNTTSMQFHAMGATIYRGQNNQPVLTAKRQGNLYCINGTVVPPNTANIASANYSNVKLWHRRLGHIGRATLETMLRHNSVQGLPQMTDFDIGFCNECAANKMTRSPFPERTSRTSGVLDLIHSDICGPMQTTTIGGNRYFITFIDDYSRKAHTYCIKTKDQALETFASFKNLVENETGRHIKILRTDRGGEYVNHAFDTFLKRHGIRHQTTAPHTPQQNGVAERFNRTVVEMGRTMLNNAKLPYRYWGEAVNTATYIRNRCVHKYHINEHITPIEAWSGQKPDISHFRIFGCEAYALVQTDRGKFEPKGERCIFIGYEADSKAYRLWSQERHKIIISRDVKFNEDNDNDIYVEIPTMTISQETLSPSRATSSAPQSPQRETSPAPTPLVEDDDDERDATPPPPTKATRTRKPLATNLGSYWDPPTEPRKRKEYATFAYAFAMASSILNEPQTYEEAIQSHDKEKWHEAMTSEYESLIENRTWDLVPLPEDKEPIGSRWVYKIKQKADGSVERYKARFVAKGFSQHQGIDYDETFSPVFKLASLRTILSIGATLDLEMEQMDVKTAFLNGDIDAEVYVEQPQGFERGDKDNVKLYCRLNKGLYGLKQAARIWNKKITKHLIEQGFQQCANDPCIYVRHGRANDYAMIGVWVGDLTIIAHRDKIDEIKKSLRQAFKMTDQGELSYILGISITRNRQERTIHLSQPRYAEAVLERFRMSDCHPVSTPADTSVRLVKPKANEGVTPQIIDDKVPYRQAIGSLMYLMLATRPDISAAVNKVAQYASSYDNSHWTAIKRILRYVKGTKDQGLTLGGNVSEIRLLGSCDADWAGDLDDRRSTTGYLFTIGTGCISWQTRKQSSVATSSTQAEYQALSMATREAIWLRELLSDLGFPQENQPTIIHQDNQSTISLARNPIQHNRTKHIDIAHHYVRECIENGSISIEYCPTSEMTSDALTKPLAREKFDKCRNKMGVGIKGKKESIKGNRNYERAELG
jgi:transposase InsO family protein